MLETPTISTSRKFGYLPALDGIRAVAIVAVFGVHVRLLPGGGMGVMMFFVLSGFLITTLLLNERHNTGAISLRLFYARRALRLLPAVVVVIMAACLVALSDRGTVLSHETLHFAPAALFYVGNWQSAVHPYFVGGTLAHTWTLSVEEQFYIVWALVLALLIKVGARLRIVAMVALAGAALSDAGKLVLWRGGTVSGDANRMYGTDLAADGLMLGCALAVVIIARPRAAARVARVAVLPAAGFLFAVICFIHPLVGTFAQARAFDAAVWPMCSVASAILIAYVVLVPASPLVVLLGSRPSAFLGRISYGVYLWHYPVLIWLTTWFGFNDRWWQIAITAAASLAAALASYRFVELPALRLKDRLRPGPTEDRRPMTTQQNPSGSWAGLRRCQ